MRAPLFLFFFFNDTATTEIYTLSLHDALPISAPSRTSGSISRPVRYGMARLIEAEIAAAREAHRGQQTDRKSTRLNSSHSQISYAVFCLKKKKKNTKRLTC